MLTLRDDLRPLPIGRFLLDRPAYGDPTCRAAQAWHGRPPLDTPPHLRLQLYQAINAFAEDMYTGQRLDLHAREDNGYQPSMIDRYRRVVFLITGSRVRLGFDCGQLLAGQAPNAAFGRAGCAVGVVRQVLVDFDYYFDEHHEPFGDCLGGLNRLPELLFKRNGGVRAEVVRAWRRLRRPGTRPRADEGRSTRDLRVLHGRTGPAAGRGGYEAVAHLAKRS
jgi:Polyprenyl synthetase